MEAGHLTDVGGGSSQHSLTLLPSPVLLLIVPLAQAVEREGQGLDLSNLSPAFPKVHLRRSGLLRQSLSLPPLIFCFKLTGISTIIVISFF